MRSLDDISIILINIFYSRIPQYHFMALLNSPIIYVNVKGSAELVVQYLFPDKIEDSFWVLLFKI